MDGLHRMTNAPWELKLGEKVYKLSAPPAGFMGELEAHLISKRRSPLEVAYATIGKLKLTDSQRDKLVAEALRQETQPQRASQRDVLEYLDTDEGVAFFLWLTLRKHHPEIDSLEKARKLAEEQYGEDLRLLAAKLDQVSGQSEIKNSPEQAPPLETAVQISPSNGQTCSAT